MEVRVLLIEDNPGDARLILEMLKEAGADRFVVHRADHLSAGLEMLSTEAAAVVLLDLNLPDSRGLATFSRLHARFPETPIVVLTVLNNLEAGIEAVRAGAQDYLVKGVISGTVLARALRYGIERKRAEEALRESELRYRRFVERNVAGVLRSTLDGRILDCNHAMARIFGYESPQELRGHRTPEFFFNPADREAMLSRLRQDKALINHETCFKRKDGSPFWALVNVALAEGEDRAGDVLEGTIIDISERRRAEKAEAAARKMELQYRGLFEHMCEGLAYCRMLFENGEGRDFIYLAVNHAFETSTGLKDVTGKRVTQVIPGIRESDPGLFEVYARVALTGIPEKFETFVRALGIWFSISVYSPEKEFFVTIFDVITERKRAEAENLRLATAIEQAAEGVVVTDVKARIEYVNPAFTKMTGYSREQAIGRNPRFLRSGRQGPEFYQEMWAAVLAGKVWQGELVNQRKDGSLYTEEQTIAPVRDSHGLTTHFIAIKQDVTERKRAEEKIRASLREKEILLREIHHRVKNNMQLISSLYGLEMGPGRDGLTRDAVREVRDRIRSMALIHEKLYRSGDLARIEFAEYIRGLAAELFRLYRPDPEDINLGIESGGVWLDLDTAIPCGLIVNELLSNCLKHGFPGGRKGQIEVTLSSADDHTVKLVVSDDGVGFPAGFDFGKTESFGLQLVNMLVEQLGGSIALESEGRTRFEIAFPASKR